MNLVDAYAELWSHKMPHQMPEQQYSQRVRLTAGLFPDLPAGSYLVDLGAGGGAMLYEGKKRGWKVTGYEFGSPICAWLCERGYDARQADLSTHRLELQDVDIITCCDVIEHLLDPHFAMTEAYRVMKPGGHIFVSTPNMSHWRRIASLATGIYPRTSGDSCLKDGGHIGFYGALDLVELLKNVGFKSVRAHYLNEDPQPNNLELALRALGGNKSWLNFTYQIAMAAK